MSLILETIITWIVQRPWVGKLMLAVVAALIVATVVLSVSLQIVTAQRDSAQARHAELSARVELQNQEVDRWQQETKKQKELAVVAEERASRLRRDYQARAARTMGETVPAACPEAVAWGVVHGIELARIWEGKQ